ncbi:hypothetical protein [Streptomyces sp. NPDC058739]|uniref:hypothetical protein n=1 Tax=Streptomyces sp. NPDC058739 TaxID=3346618 RepID=UPI0036B8BD45
MRSLPLSLALTARLTPVAVLACAGWVLTSGPETSSSASAAPSQKTGTQSASGSSASAAPRTYATSPAPCTSLAKKTITSLVPSAKTAGKEIKSTDSKVRRTCSWNALDGYEYRWLDVSFEVMDSDAAAEKSYQGRVEKAKGGGEVPGLGDAGYSVVNLTTEDGQKSREGMVLARTHNALVVVTYTGSDFESKDAPSTDEINKGAIKAAKEATAALENGGA